MKDLLSQSHTLEEAMWDLLGALLLLGILLTAFAVVAWYTYLAWFQTEELRQKVMHMMPVWQKKLPIWANALKWMESPIYTFAVRVTTVAGLLFCIFLLVLAAKPIALAFIQAFR
jgi:hypothetical protein